MNVVVLPLIFTHVRHTFLSSSQGREMHLKLNSQLFKEAELLTTEHTIRGASVPSMICTAKGTAEQGVPTMHRLLNITVAHSQFEFDFGCLCRCHSLPILPPTMRQTWLSSASCSVHAQPVDGLVAALAAAALSKLCSYMQLQRLLCARQS